MVTSGTSALGVTDHLNVGVNVIFASVILKAGAFLMSYLQSVVKEVSFSAICCYTGYKDSNKRRKK